METEQLARIAAAVRGSSATYARYQPLRIAGTELEGWIATTSVVRSRTLAFGEWFPKLGLDRLDLRGRTVLDVGCNTGSVCLEASRAGAARVVGVDADTRIIEHASIWSALAALDVVWPLACAVAFEVGDVRSAGARFDVVLCLSVLQHVHELRSAVHALADRTAGTLVLEIQTPASEVPHVALDELPDLIANPVAGETYGHGHFPTMTCMMHTLRELGFARFSHVGPGRVCGREVLHAHR